jgi:hypothetical protein
MSEIRYTPNDEPTLGNVIRRQWKTQADFTYSILGNVISIIDLGLGNRSVTNDIENVLRKIEYYHQGSIAAFHIMYRDSEGIGMESTGTANVLRSLRCAKSKKDKRGRGFRSAHISMREPGEYGNVRHIV